jgi:hypothetical protein
MELPSNNITRQDKYRLLLEHEFLPTYVLFRNIMQILANTNYTYPYECTGAHICLSE